MFFSRLFLAFLFFCLPLFSFSQGSISGYMFGDLYAVVDHRDEAIDGMNGFWFRRIYFTYDHKFSEKVSTRFRLELNSSGDFKTKDSIKPYVKDAYLSYAFGKSKSFLGISPTPTKEYIEGFWGYRAVEKTPADLYKVASSRDFGIAFKGSISKNFSYHLLIANGEGTKSEVNKQKRVYLSLLFKKKPFFFEVYADHGPGKDEKDITVYQSFLGIKNKKVTLGFQYYKHIQGQGPDKEEAKIDVYSAFLNLDFSKNVTMLMRIDKMDDPNPFIGKVDYIPFATTNPFFLYLIGIDFKIRDNISVIPNLEFVNYEKNNGTKPSEDVYAKITLYFSWK